MNWNNDNPWNQKPGNNGPKVDFSQFKLPSHFHKMGIGMMILIALCLYLATGFYTVKPEEQGVVLRFGEVVRIEKPGLHYHLPRPIERVLKPKVTRENRVDVGFRTTGRQFRLKANRNHIAEESAMLTRDENIINLEFVVLWRIQNAANYLFNVRDPETTVQIAAESTMRSIVAQTPFQEAYTSKRDLIEEDAKTNLQGLLDQYKAGIVVKQVQLLTADLPKQVVEAANEVQRAKTSRERLRNEAEAYQNKVLPEARGQAERALQEANAYREHLVNKSKGDAKRFGSIYEAYRLDKDITRKRLYLEMMESVLGAQTKKLIVDGLDKGSQSFMPFIYPGTNPQTGATQPKPPIKVGGR
jgi:membrane protease subunit HflK